MDTLSRPARSALMSRIRSIGNLSTEKVMRSALVRSGIRGWRLHDRKLPGVPDFVFENYRFAIFIDGCFWHGCPKCYRRPHSNNLYWDIKIKKNAQRDRQVNSELRRLGWSIIRIWEHNLDKPQRAVNRILRGLAWTKTQKKHIRP